MLDDLSASLGLPRRVPNPRLAPTVGPRGRDLYSVEAVAAILGVSPRTVYAWVASHDLAHYRIGRLIKVSRNQLDQFLDRKERPVED